MFRSRPGRLGTTAIYSQKRWATVTMFAEQLISVPDTASASPMYFSSGSRKLFGWLHTPNSQSSQMTGLVLCKPFGFEAMSAHLSIRAFADMAADAGFPALRFDYGGTGDSEDLEPGIDQIEAWIQDVLAAISALRAHTGVRRICLLGFRLGTLIAVLAASRCVEVESLVAIAPVINGRRYLSELRTFELAAAHPRSALALPSRDANHAGPGCMQVSGYFLSASTVTSLRNWDLTAIPSPRVSHVLVIDRDDIAGAAAWRDRLRAEAIDTRYVTLPGFVAMMMRAPNLTTVPTEMIAMTRSWLLGCEIPKAVGNAPSTEPISMREAISPATLTLTTREGRHFTETAVLLRSEPALFGILTVPPKGSDSNRAVILLNAGGDHHIGPRRLYVNLARRWVERGYCVLRMDISGLGDSDAYPGRERNYVFPSTAIDDVGIAIEYVRHECGAHDITLGGLCSGAFHCLRAAVSGLRVNRLLLVNPLNFHWDDGMDIDGVQPWEVVQKPTAYIGRAFSIHSWKRLWDGDVSIWRIVNIYLRTPLLALRTQLRKIARALKFPLKNDLASELRHLADRGIEIRFLFSSGDAGIKLLKVESGLSPRKLAMMYGMRTIEGADHNFTLSGHRAVLEETLSDALYSS